MNRPITMDLEEDSAGDDAAFRETDSSCGEKMGKNRGGLSEM